MTRLGEIFIRKSINKADVARKTGMTSQRIGVLTLDQKAKLTAAELYLIAKAIDEDPCKLLEYVCQDLELGGKEGK
ncbi:MAG: helix-turn-helix transcriptional regulator [Algoriphagus sp.]|uniref:helix-turn-helix domain-containing protein n=1 Tax=Algoriphagus sp. TaxID=1872435 RepID=UPI002736AE56|nr:helix-turn-helix transcriptional regulator [Algoriphagus sp.]MDP3198925.1 helix-turn-helix transcriptional regulator [Algoriphagus sp.]